MLIIFPPLLLSIDLAASFERRNTALSCVSMTLSQSSDFSCNTPPLSDTLPALFTRVPIPPSSLSTLLSAGSNPARLVTSTLTATDGTPIVFNSESTCWFFSSFRPNTATAAPVSANPSAMLRPIPPLPPVTTATRPVKSNNAALHRALPILCSLIWKQFTWTVSRHPVEVYRAVIAGGQLPGLRAIGNNCREQTIALTAPANQVRAGFWSYDGQC